MSCRARLLFASAVWLLAGCVSQEVRTVDMTPPDVMDVVQSEDELLDIGIAIFDPNVPESYDEQVAQLIQPDVRRAEANFIPYFAKNLLQSTGNWGAVRVIPRRTHAVDVVVSGKILHSDGESMEIQVTVSDATGRTWFQKPYEALASKYAYDPTVPANVDPFQTIYKNLANDMLDYRKNLSREQVLEIRTTAEMKFAQEFAPDAFADYLVSTEDGEAEVRRLPAENDPNLQRVRKVREREYLFIDTLDEYYEGFHRSMYTPYQSWRKATYEEAITYKKLREQARSRMIGGTVAIVGGVAAMAESSDSTVDTGALVSIIGGAVTLKSAIAKRAEAEIQAEMLQEVGIAAEAEIMPHTIELENQVVRLQGTVDEQYDELRLILRDLYFADLGLPVPEPPDPDTQ